MAAVIGRVWLSAQDENGSRLLGRPRDWVHDEIADALALGLPVLPVLIRDTALPAVEDLPADIGGRVTRQAIRIASFDHDGDTWRLIHCVAALDPGLAADRPRETPTAVPAWVARTSAFLHSSAAQIYSVAYKPEIAAPLIRLTQALGGDTTAAASVPGRMPDRRKAAAILEAMGKPGALPILRAHLRPAIRYDMAAGDRRRAREAE